MIDGLRFSADELRISKPGRSVESSDLDDFLLHESMRLEIVIGGARLISSLTFAEPDPANPGYYISVTRFAHDLGYAPQVELIGYLPGYDIVCDSTPSQVVVSLANSPRLFGTVMQVNPPLVLHIYGTPSP